MIATRENIFFLLLHFILSAGSLIIISLGLAGEFDFNTAKYGSTLVIGLGIVSFSVAVEIKHNFSVVLWESWLFKSINVRDIETKLYSNLFTLLIFLISVCFALAAVFSIGIKNDYSVLLFSTCVVIFSMFLGIFMARLFVLLLSSRSTESVTQEDNRKEEFEHNELTNFLLGKSEFEKQFKTKIYLQSELICEEISRDINGGSDLVDRIIEVVVTNLGVSEKDFPKITDKILSIDSISKPKVLNSWTSFSLKKYYSSIDNDRTSQECFSKLTSHILLNPLTLILKHIYSTEPDTIVKNYNNSDKVLLLLMEATRFIGRENLFISSLSNYTGLGDSKSNMQSEQINLFLHSVANYSNPSRENEVSQWSPWWLMNLRVRLSILRQMDDWRETIQRLNKPNTVNDEEFVEICSRVFRVVSLLLSDTGTYPENTQEALDLIGSRYTAIYGAQLKSSFGINLEKAVARDGSLTDRLIKISYVIFKELAIVQRS